MIGNLIGLDLPIRWCEYNFFSCSEYILDSFLLFVECYTSAFCINHFLARFHAYLFLLHINMHYLHAISTHLNICSWTKNPAVPAIIVIGSLLYFEWYIYTFLWNISWKKSLYEFHRLWSIKSKIDNSFTLI